MAQCKLTMLGTGHAGVTRCFNTCFVISTPKSSLLTDCGGGNTLLSALKHSGIKLSTVHRLFITHSHIDHFWGAVPLIVQILSEQKRGLYEGTLTIYSHSGVISKLKGILEIMLKDKDLKRLSDLLILTELKDGQSAVFDDLTLTAFDLQSSHEPQFGYALTLPDGKKVACLGDEPYHECNFEQVKGCDYLLCEAFCLKSEIEKYNPYRIHHSTAADAAIKAQKLGVKNLVLYHTEDDHLDKREELYTAEARAHFKGRIFVPCDLQSLTLD